MLKFIKKHLESIQDVEIYPIISLLVFFIFFVALSYWVVSARKEFIEKARQIPFETK